MNNDDNGVKLQKSDFEWPALPDFPESFAHIAGHAYFTEHQMQGYANAYGKEVRRVLATASPEIRAVSPDMINRVWNSMPGRFLVEFGYHQFAEALLAEVGVKVEICPDDIRSIFGVYPAKGGEA
ncbi:hypothetical protein [Burkholderia glumae]